MSANGPRLTRRRFFELLGAAGGAAAVHHGLSTLGLLGSGPAQAATLNLPPDLGRGRRVVVLGAGMAGLCAAYELAIAGFEVTVLEAAGRIGGRSFTARRGDSYREIDGPLLTSAFDEGLYLNAGPGRIPSYHVTVLDYCRRFNVAMEPFVFVSRSNLMQSDDFDNGRPIRLQRVDAALRGQVAEMLSKVSDQKALDRYFGDSDRESFLAMLRDFGDLTQLRDGSMEYRGSERQGFVVPPGAGRSPGTLPPDVALDDILNTSLWKNGLFNDLRLYWQSTLMQPKGGMDMIWKGFLRQRLPDGRTLEDLVRLDAAASSIENTGAGVRVSVGSEVIEADFCVSTMAPTILARVESNLSAQFVAAMRDWRLTPACKVGWQARRRFWEEDDEIYGGISWTRHEISQIWYPSDEFFSDTGVLTGAYNNGAIAEAFGDLTHDERLRVALEGGERLHPGFTDWVHADRGLSIAWKKMPHIEGGWSEYTHETNPDIYRRADIGEGNVILAGDFLSQMPGWKEGALLSAQRAVGRIAFRVAQENRAMRPANSDVPAAKAGAAN